MKEGLLINNESKIGNEILAHLVDHPNARDTLEGIVEWWLLERQIKFQTARVKEALSDLVDKELLLERKGANSHIHYQLNPTKYNEIQGLFTRISLFEKVHFYNFVMLIELVSVRILPTNLNQKEIGIHSNLTVLQAPTGCPVAAC